MAKVVIKRPYNAIHRSEFVVKKDNTWKLLRFQIKHPTGNLANLTFGQARQLRDALVDLFPYED